MLGSTGRTGNGTETEAQDHQNETLRQRVTRGQERPFPDVLSTLKLPALRPHPGREALCGGESALTGNWSLPQLNPLKRMSYLPSQTVCLFPTATCIQRKPPANDGRPVWFKVRVLRILLCKLLLTLHT